MNSSLRDLRKKTFILLVSLVRKSRFPQRLFLRLRLVMLVPRHLPAQVVLQSRASHVRGGIV